MAEFLGVGTRIAPSPNIEGDDGFAAMGKPVPMYRRTAALSHARDMGLGTDEAWRCVGELVNKLERDEPYDAMAAGMKYVDLTGTYRLMAVLLTAPAPKE